MQTQERTRAEAEVSARDTVRGVPTPTNPASRSGLFRLRRLRLTIGEAESPPEVRRREAIYRRLLAVADIGAAALALIVSLTVLGDDQVRVATLVALPVFVLVAKVVGLYDRDELVLQKSTLEEAPALFQLATMYALLFVILERVFLSGYLGQGQLAALWMGLFVGQLGARALARVVAGQITASERCLVMGDPAACDRIQAKLSQSGTVQAEVVLCVRLTDSDGVLSITDASDFRALAEAHGVHRVIVAPGHHPPETVLDTVRLAKDAGLRVSIMPTVLEAVGSAVESDNVEGMTLLGVPRFGLTKSSELVKRAFDLVGAGFAVLVAAPALGVIAILVKLDSRGPVMFSQERVGKDGKTFELLKFRSMVVGADQQKDELRDLNEADGLFKISDDPRITRVGRVLRSTSLDELPQLMNVLRGEMSLVGPRPLVIEDDSRVEGWHRRRLRLKPGMTGHWQIFGSSRIPLQEMVKIDYLYVATWTLWEDIKILLRTVPYVLARRGL
jgi:exopolysaccharide biosynthesis polyprenyl glycosylphosphotransferase